jgi:hypothetical protein
MFRRFASEPFANRRNDAQRFIAGAGHQEGRLEAFVTAAEQMRLANALPG